MFTLWRWALKIAYIYIGTVWILVESFSFRIYHELIYTDAVIEIPQTIMVIKRWNYIFKRWRLMNNSWLTSLPWVSCRLSAWLCPVLLCPSLGLGSSSCRRLSCSGELERELENKAPGPAASSSSPTEELALGEHSRGPGGVWVCVPVWHWNWGWRKGAGPGTKPVNVMGVWGSMEVQDCGYRDG